MEPLELSFCTVGISQLTSGKPATTNTARDRSVTETMAVLAIFDRLIPVNTIKVRVARATKAVRMRSVR